jgi:hypothetical protein
MQRCQATLKSLEQELLDAKAQHTAHMQQLRSQHSDLEAHTNSMLQQAQQRLSTTALVDSELSAARDKATAAAELEAAAEASSHRSGPAHPRCVCLYGCVCAPVLLCAHLGCCVHSCSFVCTPV